MSTIGHNSGRGPKPEKRTAGDKKRDIEADATDERLRLLVERIERLEEEKKELASDIREIYAEAKATGYDTKIMRQIVQLRKMDPNARSELEMLLETYKCALGMG